MRRDTQQKAEFVMKVACDAVAVIQDYVEQGRTEAEIRQVFVPCSEAKTTLESMGYRLNRMDEEKRARFVAALEMLTDYIRNTRDPAAAAEETWVVETVIVQILDKFGSYQSYEAKHYNNPLNLLGFVSFITEATATISELIAKGYIKVAGSSEKKLEKEWENRPYNPKVDVLPDKGVYTNEWSMSDINRLAEKAQKDARAYDKKRTSWQ
jgi:hypothetical protein